MKNIQGAISEEWQMVFQKKFFFQKSLIGVIDQSFRPKTKSQEKTKIMKIEQKKFYEF